MSPDDARLLMELDTAVFLRTANENAVSLEPSPEVTKK
jgi:hypothetical protein